MPNSTQKVEFLCAREDNTWDTSVVAVPLAELTSRVEESMVDWAYKNLTGQEQYKDVVLFAVYNSDVGDEEDGQEDTSGHQQAE